MSDTAMAEVFLDLGSTMIHHKEMKKVIEFFQGENQLMNYLYKNQSQIVHPNEISRDLSISQARVALLLNRLEKDGYIVREIDPNDLRKTIVGLTDIGVEESYARKQESINYVLGFIHKVGKKDCQKLINISKKFSD